MHTLHNIQVLRAFAALLVVLHHFLPQFDVMGGKNALVTFISTWGFTGVDIFFVISGFIMVYTSFDKERGYDVAKTFLIHRLSRIFLGYWPFFLAMLFTLYRYEPVHLQTLDIFGSFSLLNANMFQLVLPVSWSLSYELYFYMMFVLTFFLSQKQLSILLYHSLFYSLSLIVNFQILHFLTLIFY